MFADHLAGMTDAVFETFGEPGGGLLHRDGLAAIPIRVSIERGTGQVGGWAERDLVVGRSTARVPFADIASLVEGDEIEIPAGRNAGRWRVAEAAERPGGGSRWVVQVDPVPAP